MKLKEIREKYPQYSNMSDTQLAGALKKKYYPDMDISEFSRRIGLNEGIDPTEGMSTAEKFFAGAGKSFIDTGNGIRQLAAKIGIGDEKKVQSDIDENKAISEPLMSTGGGMVGNVVGMATQAIPAAFIPGVNTYLGAGALGGAMGAAQPVASDDSRLENTAFGAIGGVAGNALGRSIPAIFKGGKAIAEPFYKGGRENIVGRTLGTFSGDKADDVISSAKNAQSLIPGSKPTLAEAVQDPAISGFQLAARSAHPEIKQALGHQEIKNTAARISALRDIAGDDGKLAFFKANREDVANTMYQNAFDEQVADSPWVKGQLTQLMKRPAFKSALREAQTLALNKGIKLDPKNAVEVAHYTKLAIDDQISNATGNQRAALMDIKNKLLTTMESKSFSPSYGAARKTYADMSKPINQMEIGQELLNKLQPALMDFSDGAITRTKAETYAQALRNAEQTAKTATGFPVKALDQVMSPEQMATLNSVGKDLARKAVSEDMAKTTNSTTAQNLATQNMIRQLLGPLGVPEQFSQSSLLQSLARPLEFAYKVPEQRMIEVLSQALSDPQYAAKIMQGVRPKSLTPQQALAIQLMKELPASSGASLAVSNRQ